MTTPTPFQFLETIFRESLHHGQLMVWSQIRRSGKTTTDWCYTLKQAARQVESYRKRREIFFGVALHDRQKALARARQRNYRAAPTRVRGSEESVTALPALWAELAVADLTGPDRHAALAHIEATSPPPSILVWTGAAYQAYWLLAEPWVLENEEDHRRAKRLLGKVQWALAGAGDAGCDLAGLMQVAGTFHHLGSERGQVSPPTPQGAIPVVLERHPRDEAEGRWALRDFEQLEDPPERPPAYPWPDGEGADVPTAGGNLPPVWQGCSWLRHCYHHQATLPEAEWTAALSLVGRCQAGPAAGASLARSFSHGHPGYLPGHTDQQLERALGDKSGPATCRRIGGALGAWDGHCSRCPHQGRIESPIDLGQEKEIPAAVEDPAPAPVETEKARQLPAPRRSVAAPVPVGGPRGGLTVPVGGPRGGWTAGVEIEVVFRISPGAGSPAAWAPRIEAAIGCLAGASAADSPDSDPDAGPGPRSAAAAENRQRPTSRLLLAGLEEVVSALGGPATAHRIVETLAAEENRERFERLRSALRQLFPGLEGGLPTARQLGYALRAYGRASPGERQLVAAGRNNQGVTWALRKTSAP